MGFAETMAAYRERQEAELLDRAAESARLWNTDPAVLRMRAAAAASAGRESALRFAALPAEPAAPGPYRAAVLPPVAYASLHPRVASLGAMEYGSTRRPVVAAPDGPDPEVDHELAYAAALGGYRCEDCGGAWYPDGE